MSFRSSPSRGVGVLVLRRQRGWGVESWVVLSGMRWYKMVVRTRLLDLEVAHHLLDLHLAEIIGEFADLFSKLDITSIIVVFLS